MIEAAVSTASVESVESALRGDLARGQDVADTVVPVLRHLLANDANSVFSEEVIASMRGMLQHMAVQMLDALAQVSGEEDKREHDQGQIAALTGNFLENPALVGHLHSLALEWQLTHRVQATLAIDAVLTPMLQALIASQDDTTAALAMKLLAAQARFGQLQRRMQLPLNELPGDLLHSALLSLRTLAGTDPEADELAGLAQMRIKAGYDEAASRLGLLARLVEEMASGAMAALSLRHAGVALFLSAMSIGSGQDRDVATLSTDEAQAARFALALRACGLKLPAIEEQLLALHPDISLPEGFDRLNSDRAAAILSTAGYQRG